MDLRVSWRPITYDLGRFFPCYKLGANYEKITCLVLFVLFFSTALGLEDTHHVGSCNTVMREYVSYELRDAS